MPEAAERLWTSPDGLSLFARDYAPGSGPARAPVICLHGLTRNSRDFEVLAPHIARTSGRRVLALDARGRGRSARDPNPLNYAPVVYAGDVAALMAQAGVSRAVFIGTSMGGLVATALSAMRPDLVAGAILNDIGPEIDPAGLKRITAYVGEPAAVGSWAEAEAYARRINEAALPHVTDWAGFARRLFREGAEGRPVLDYDPAIGEVFRAAPPGAAGQPGSAGQPPPDLWPLFGALAKDRPLLLVRGGASDLLSAEIAARMAAAAPRMAQVTVPGVGHAPTLEEPPVLAAVAALLDEAP